MAIRDITLGQYYPADSKIHRLDARTKIIGSIVYLISLFCVKSFTGFIPAVLFFAAVLVLSKVPLKFVLKGIKPILFLIVFTMVVNMFATPGEAIAHLGPFALTVEGIKRAVFMAIRLVLLIFGSSLLTLTTKPMQLTDGLERLMSPLRKIGLPAHEIAMMMSIALRFIPTLLDETDKIMKAQTARGADFESGNILERAKALIPLLVPLFVSAFRIAGDLAMAMEARCYRGGDGRTRMNEARFASGDYMAFIVFAVYLLLTVLLGRLTWLI